jgi:hypothetical protein
MVETGVIQYEWTGSYTINLIEKEKVPYLDKETIDNIYMLEFVIMVICGLLYIWYKKMK